MFRRRFLTGLPLFVLLGIVIYSIIAAIINNWYFTQPIIGGIISITICFILFLTKPRWFNYVFIVVLLFGCINILQFTFTNYTISFYVEFFKLININSFDIQLLSLSVLGLVLILHLKKIIKYFLLVLRD